MNHLTPDSKNNYYEIYIVSINNRVPISMGIEKCPRLYGLSIGGDHHTTYSRNNK